MPGVVVEDVDATEMHGGCRVQRLDARGVADVDRHEDGLAALPGGGLAGVARHVGHHHRRTFRREQQRRLAADPARRRR